MSEQPHIVIVTTPIRKIPTEYPPIGSLSVISALNRAGYQNVTFFDIDNLRHTYDQVLQRLQELSPAILGISAVVSTAYTYTKQLSLDVKRILPDTTIVLGGNLAASAEIVLHKTGVDFCVLGEGERVFKNFVDQWMRSRNKKDFKSVRGLMFLDNGELVNTGYEEQIPNHEIYDFDWSILEKSSHIEYFFSEPEHNPAWFGRATAEDMVRLRGKKIATIVASKGCVARCTFCHRWDKGIRYIPPEVVISRIKFVMERYNVGFVSFGDENFGTDKRWLTEFCERIKPLKIVWRVGGMRVNCIKPEYIEMMRDAGCVTIIYGMETGSAKMLQIMEKKVKVEDNYNAMEWTIGSGLYTAVQLVIGMPGEAPETIRETIEFTKFACSRHPSQNPNNVSINYAQALPGTPLYEIGRHKGLIGKSLEDEEQYIVRVSDKNASSALDTINFTDYPKLVCETWQPLIQIETNKAYIDKYGLQHYYDALVKVAKDYAKMEAESGYFASPAKLIERMGTDTISQTFSKETDFIFKMKKRPSLWSLVRKRHLRYIIIFHPLFSYRVRKFLPFFCLARNAKQKGLAVAMGLLKEYVVFRFKEVFKSKNFRFTYKSLRKIVNEDLDHLQVSSNPAMVPLRQGR